MESLLESQAGALRKVAACAVARINRKRCCYALWAQGRAAVTATGIAVKKTVSQNHSLNKEVVYTHFPKGLMTKQLARPGTKTTCPPLSQWLMIMLKLTVLYAPIKILSPPRVYNVAKTNEEMKSSTVHLLLKSPDLYCTGGMPCTELMCGRAIHLLNYFKQFKDSCLLHQKHPRVH